MGRMALIYRGVRAVECRPSRWGGMGHLVRMLFVARESGALRMGPKPMVTIDAGTFAAWVR